MSYLTLVQDFCVKRGLPSPSGVIGSSNAGVQQIAVLVKESLEELAGLDFQVLSSLRTWTAVAGEDQGNITTLFGPGYNRVSQDSLWNVTHMMQFYGPLSLSDWSALKIHPAAGVAQYFTVLGNKLLVWPALAGGETLQAIPTTDYLVTDSTGATLKTLPTVDSDLFRIPEAVIRRFLQYKWEQTKGESWATSYADAQQELLNALVASGTSTLSLSRRERIPRPGILIPAGSWNV